MRESRSTCRLDRDVDRLVVGDRLLLGQFRKATGAPEAQVIALAFAGTGDGANDALLLALGLGRCLHLPGGMQDGGGGWRERLDDPPGPRRERLFVQPL